jgi:glucosamine-6-phosphate deaminase
MKIIHAKDYADMSRKAANLISAQVILKPNSVIGLATGATPVGIYEYLADWYRKGDIDFSNVTAVNLDEYVGLSPNSDQSYRYFMNTKFFDKVNINLDKTHIPHGLAEDADEEARRYGALIESLGGIDLQLLGIGVNGHIGFNEPSAIFDKETRVVDLAEETISANARFFANRSDVPKKAVTMGLQSIMRARKIVLCASGANKKEILQKALFGPITPEVPASILQMHPDLHVFAAIE